MAKELIDLTKEELINMIKNLISENEMNSSTHNKISVCDVEVESNNESLEKCEEIVNKLIKTNHDFMTLRKNKAIAERHWGFIR